MDWNRFKLGVGPMSKDIVESCLRYSKQHNFPIMFIASRNQVDYSSGYAFTTPELVQFIKSHQNYDSNLVRICRDHCGPNFADADKGLSLAETVSRCIATIESDIQNGFDLIHIDVSRVDEKHQTEVATTLIDFVLSLEPNMALEFGSEDNTGQNLHDTLLKMDQQLQFAKRYKSNIKFLVSQTGSLTKHTQVGVFNEPMCGKIAEKIHAAGFLFKEHNADYLKKSQVGLRKATGIDSINIAPQLGYAQSTVINKLGYSFEPELKQFKEYVLQQDAWRKWVTDDVDDLETRFLVSAHYFFNSHYFKKINEIMMTKNVPFAEALYAEISLVLDQYRLGYGG